MAYNKYRGDKMNNYQIAKLIVEKLNLKGANLGNASIGIIEDVLNNPSDFIVNSFCPKCHKGILYTTGTGRSCNHCNYNE